MTGIIGDKAIKLPASSGDLASSEREHGNVMVRHNSTSGKPEFSTNGTNWTQFGTGTGGVFPVAKPETPVAGSIFYQKSDNKLKIYDGTNWYSQADAFAADAALNSGGGGQQPPPQQQIATDTVTSATVARRANRIIGEDQGLKLDPKSLPIGVAWTGDDQMIIGTVQIYSARYTDQTNKYKITIWYTNSDAGPGNTTLNLSFAFGNDTYTTNAEFKPNHILPVDDGNVGSPTNDPRNRDVSNALTIELDDTNDATDIAKLSRIFATGNRVVFTATATA